eukprot:16440854-Heterocapsa_arctica.AAC.1
MVMVARGMDNFRVEMCLGEVGRNLYKAIKKTAESSTGLYKKTGWPTPVNNRQAFAIASLSWGGRGVDSVPQHALSAADFPTVRAEAFDDHAVPTDTKLE